MRNAAGEARESQGADPDLAVWDTRLDGAKLSARGLAPSDVAALVGISELHTLDVPARIFLDDGVLVRVDLELPEGASGEGSALTILTLAYSELSDLTIDPPEDIASPR